MRPRVKGALLLLLAFALGVATGALGWGLYQERTGWWGPHRDPERFRQILLQRLTRELGLTADQRRQVETTLREAGQEFARLREEIGPRVRDIRARSREKIRAILSPDQQAKFEALESQWEHRAQRWRGETSRTQEKESRGP